MSRESACRYGGCTSGKVEWQWDNSDPFGNNVPNENPNGAGQFSFPLRFAGQYYDRETNLHYNINRDYDPSIGRYIESDPIGFRGGINIYTYVLGNPLSMYDPLGLAPKPPEMSGKHPADADSAPDGLGGLVCALYGMGVFGEWAQSSCLPKSATVCTRWLCNPKNSSSNTENTCPLKKSEPYYKGSNSKETSMTDPDTPCVCTQYGINPNGDGTLPGL